MVGQDSDGLPNLLCRPMSTPESHLKGRSTPAALLAVDMVPELFADQVCIKNTFIDEIPQLSPTLLSFYRERNVSTCPSKKVGRLMSFSESPLVLPSTPSDEEMVKTPLLSPCGFETPPLEIRSQLSAWSMKKDLFGTRGMPQLPGQACATTAPLHDVSDRQFLSLASVVVRDHHQQPMPASISTKSCGPDASDRLPPRAVPPPGPPPPPQHSPRMLSSLAAHEQRASAVICGLLAPTGSAAPIPPPPPCHSPKVLKSIGSKDHPGRCKPCAFLHTRGCGNGMLCQFCHACAPEEIKRRRKQRLEQRRAAKKALEEDSA